MFDSRYFAGFLDGEGCISIYGKMSAIYRTHTVAVRVAQTDCDTPLKILYAEFGGWLGIQKAHGPTRQSHAYHTTGNRAHRLIEAVYPFLIIKKPQAEIIINNWEVLKPRKGGFTKWLPQEIRQQRHVLYLQMRKLNSKNN